LLCKRPPKSDADKAGNSVVPAPKIPSGSEDDAEMAEAESEAEGGASGSGSDEMPTEHD
jgi:hypothetical protein